MPTIFRRALSVAGLMIAGVVVSLVVAEVAAVWSPLSASDAMMRFRAVSERDWRYFHGSGMVHVLPEPVFVERFNALEEIGLRMPRSGHSSESFESTHALNRRCGVGVDFDSLLMGLDNPSSWYGTVEAVRAGWPMRCVSATRRGLWGDWAGRVPVVAPYWTGTIEAPTWARPLSLDVGEVPRLPIGVLWWGVLGDGVVYGSAIGGVLFLAGMGRRWWRVRTERCRACGYSLRGTSGGVCPECGVSVR